MFYNFKDFDKKIAVILENGKKISYFDILLNHKKIRKFFPRKRSLFFLEASLTEEFVILYSYLLINKHPILILDSNVKKDELNVLIKKFRPNYILLNSSELTNTMYLSQISFQKYRLFISKKHKKIELNTKLSILLPTSGSTSKIKYVRCSLQNLLSNTRSIVDYLKISSSSRTVTSLPLNYVYGLSILNTHLYAGGSIIFCNKSIIQKKFWSVIKKFKCNNLNFVPYTYELINRIGKLKSLFSLRLRFLTSAGDNLEPFIIEKIKHFNKNKIPFFRMYGQAEATSRISYVPPNYFDEPNCIGIPIPGGKISIDSKSKSQIIYKGKNVTLGYAKSYLDLKKGDENNGIIHTGDSGYRGKNNLFFIKSRIRRVKKIYGKNYNLPEIEKFLKQKLSLNICVTGSKKSDKLNVFFTEKLNKKNMLSLIYLKFSILKENIKLYKIKEFPMTISKKISYKDLENKYE